MTMTREETLRRQIERLRRQDEQNQRNDLGEKGLAWLALVPAWTEELAIACKDPEFPIGKRKDLTDFLEVAEASGLCEREESGDEHEFWIRRGERQPTLRMLQEQRGFDFLRTEAHLAGESIVDVAAAKAIRTEKVRAQVLSRVAWVLATEDEKNLAGRAARQALAAAEAIADEGPRAEVLSGVALALAQVKDVEGLAQALAMAKTIEDEGSRVEALGGVLQALAQVGENEAAAETARQALATDLQRFSLAHQTVAPL